MPSLTLALFLVRGSVEGGVGDDCHGAWFTVKGRKEGRTDSHARGEKERKGAKEEEDVATTYCKVTRLLACTDQFLKGPVIWVKQRRDHFPSLFLTAHGLENLNRATSPFPSVVQMRAERNHATKKTRLDEPYLRLT